ncbi:unnamed protein product, partial [Onchocerca flexuosa]
IPTNHRGEPLPRDKYGNFIYPATGLGVELPPTDKSGKLVYPVVDPHGEPLSTNEDGAVVDFNGYPIPTNEVGLPVDEYGKSLPKDSKGNFIFGIPIRPTDQRGLPIYAIIGPNGEFLPTDESGRVIGPDGHPISIDNEGKPINNRGEPLPTDRLGNFIYPFKGLDAELPPTDSSGLPIYSVMDSYGQILPTNGRGLAIDDEGKPLPTNAAGVPIDDHGKILPTDSNGNLVYRKVQKPLSTDESGQLIYPVIEPDSELLPTEKIDAVVVSDRPTDKMTRVELDIESLPTDSNGRRVYPVIGANQELLPTNEDGAVVDRNGNVIPTNADGVPIDQKGVPLPTDASGKVIYQESAIEAYPTDRLGRRIYKVIGPDGNYLPVDIDGGVLDPQGRPIPTDESGNLVDMEGRPLPKDRDGNIIYIAKPLPTDQNGKPIYSIIGPDKVLLPTNEEGRPIDEEGKPIPTNAAGMPVDNYGKLLPTDVKGNLLYLTKTTSTASVMVPGWQVIGPEGVPLSTSSDGLIFGPDGKVLVTDENGWPLDEEGKPMPTDIYNNIIYPIKLPDGSTLPTDLHGRPVYPVIGPDGELLPTTESGLVIGLDGSPLSTNAAGKPIGLDSSPLPTDEEGRVIYLPPEASSSMFATNEYGQIVYPIVDTDGRPLDKDDSGAYITRNGIPVELNENHLPVDPDGNVLPTDSRGNYIFPDLDVMGRMLPTDKTGRALYPVIGPNGQLLPTDSSGAIIGLDGEILPTNKFGKPVGLDGKPLPTDNEGQFVYSEVAGTDSTKKMIINVVDDRGRPLPTDELGRYLLAPNRPLQQDDTGRLIGPDGEPLPTDDFGNYVYRDKAKYPSEDFGRPLPTDRNGFYMRKDDSIITTELPMDEQGVVLPTDEHGLRTKFPTRTKLYQILDEKNQLMPTDEAGNFLDHEGHPIAENEEGKPVSADGVVLPTTDMGYYVFDTIRQKPMISTGKSMQDIYEIEGKLQPIEEDDQLIAKEEEDEKIRLPEPDDRILPTDEYGRHIYPVAKPDGEPYPTDRGQRPIYPVIGSDGKLLPTNDEGLALDIRGDPIPTNSIGRPLDEDGVMLPIDSEGNAVYHGRRKQCDTRMGVMDIAVVINVETLNPDSFEHVKRVIQNLVNEYFDLAPDMTQFAVIKYSGAAEIPITLGGYNEKMELLEELGGMKIDHMKEHPRLNVGISAAKQQFISFGRDYAGKLMIVITDGQDTYPKDRLNDDNIPMLVVGIREFEEEIKDWTKSYILTDSWEQLRADSIAKMIEKECSLGRIFIPMKKAYRSSSPPNDELGRILIVPTSERIIPRRYTDYQRSSYPFNSDDNIMMAKRTRKITHTTDSTRSFLYPVIDPDNIPKDASYILRTDNKLLSTAKKSLSLTSVTDTNFHRRPLYSLSDQIPSGEYNRIYFKDPVSEPRATDGTGNFISSQNRSLPIEISQSGKPIGAETRSDQIQKGRKPTVVDLFGKPLPTNKYGDSIYADGSIASTDSSRQLVGSLMPVDDRGRYASDHVPDRIALQESELLAEASRCNKVEESANIILMVESSNATRMKLNKIKLSLLNFVKKNIDWRIAKIGMVSYGSRVDVNLDIGNYQSYDDLKESILSLPIIGGTASGDEHAFRTALQLFREKYNIDSGELIVHIFKTPLSKDAQIITNHLKVNETISILSLGSDKWYRLERDKEIKKLRSDMCLMLMKSHLAQSRKPDDEAKDKMKSGDISMASSSVTPSESEMTGKSLSRDENGFFLHSIVSPDDQLLPTNGFGAPTDSFGRFVLHDNVSTPIDPNGRRLSKDDQGRYTYPAIGISDIPLPTDVNKRPIYSVKGSDGQPLPTDRTGRAIDSGGKLIPTDEGGKPIGSNGSVLPTDINGWFLLAEEEIGKVLSVDRDIIGSRRKSLLTSSSGLSGKATPVDKYGGLVDVDGLSLTTDSSGKFLLESQTKKTLSSDKYSHIKYSKIDRSSLPTDSSGILLDSLGMPIPTDDTGKPLGPDGKVLPMDKYGRYIYASVGQDRRIFSTKKLKGPIYSTRQPIMLETVIPTDDQGFYIYPAFQPDEMLLSPDAQKKLPITAVGSRSLSTDSKKNLTTPNGKLISMSDFEKTSNNDDSQPLTDEDRIFVFGKEKKLLHSTAEQDGKLLSADRSAHYLDSRGKGSVAITNTSNIYSSNGRNILSTISTSDLHVYPTTEPDELLSSIGNSGPVYTEVDSHGQRLPMNERTSMILESRRLPIRIDEHGKPVRLNGSSLQTDEFGRYVFGITDRKGGTPSTDKVGHSIYPVVSSDGKFLSTNSEGTKINNFGRSIPTDESGLPIDSEDHIVPTDGASNLYAGIDGSRRILHKYDQSIPHRYGQSIFTGQSLKTISDRFVSATSGSLPLILFPDGRPLPVDKNGTYLDDNGHSVVHIDENGRPVISADGTPLQKTNDGRYLYPYESQQKKPSSVNVGDDDHLLRTDPNHEVQLNGRGEPLDGFGKLSPEDEYGNYRWSMKTTMGISTLVSPSSVCVINSNVDMLVILDASSTVRIVDYRIMKDFIKNFLINYFNLQRNYVRVGVIKFGDKVEVPVSLGDYESQTELLSRISEIRRMRGEAHLGQALLDAAGEFLIFGSKDIPRIVIIFSNGQSRDNLKENARLLREDAKAYVFLVDVGNQSNNTQNLAIVGEPNSHRIITIDGWHKANAKILDPFLDELCK